MYEGSNLPAEKIAGIRGRLVSILGEEHVSDKEVDKIAYSKDYWPLALRWTLERKVAGMPDFIAWPENTEQVSQVVRLANEYGISVIPFGEGSGVMGSAIPVKGGIMLDMKRMDRILEINDEDLVLRVQPGMNGEILERTLVHKGYTLANIPQSIRCSTVGGWIGCRAAGQFSTKYGKIDDMFLSLEAVLPNGEVMRSKLTPKSSTGPQVDRLFLGSEGILGIVTEVALRIWPAPGKRVLASYVFDKLGDSLETVRMTIRTGIYPAVVRIYDRLETERHFLAHFKEVKNKIILILVMEGAAELVELEDKVSRETALANNGKPLGDGPVQRWFKTRFNVKEAAEFAPRDVVFDTIEVSTVWSNAGNLYNSMVKAMAGVEGVIIASAHGSHFYPQGVCFYFTFGGVPPKGTDGTEFYRKVWDAAMEACLIAGGSISHHHGMGIMRSQWLRRELGEGGFNALKAIKDAWDPSGILNPGKLVGGEQK
ncbi:MAG: FAD-binding oxidoreductase [Thermoplasmata archaeon HGW-Thermoplasmata-1]|nr:MAG: FAD-binding oxidoreductase [Thermoplasmata archaeon HGW-Thermoplasmata-1]